MQPALQEDEVAAPAAAEPRAPIVVRVPLLSACIAESVGTFLMVLLGLGSVQAAVLARAQAGVWPVAVVWGIGVAMAIHATAAISGAHINPAITAALAVWRGFPRKRVVPYWVAQLIGAVLAAATLNALFDPFLRAHEAALGIVRGSPESVATAMCFGEYFPNPGLPAELKAVVAVSEPAACFAEFLGTAVLAFVVFALTEERNRARPGPAFTPWLIGFTVTALIIVIAPITQAGFNPARDFGPRLVAFMVGFGRVAIPGPAGGFLTVYILSPILGAVVGGGAFHLLLRPRFAART